MPRFAPLHTEASPSGIQRFHVAQHRGTASGASDRPVDDPRFGWKWVVDKSDVLARLDSDRRKRLNSRESGRGSQTLEQIRKVPQDAISKFHKFEQIVRIELTFGLLKTQNARRR
jgi:hypothetical protein